jgi:hypothetical protein
MTITHRGTTPPFTQVRRVFRTGQIDEEALLKAALELVVLAVTSCASLQQYENLVSEAVHKAQRQASDVSAMEAALQAARRGSGDGGAAESGGASGSTSHSNGSTAAAQQALQQARQEAEQSLTAAVDHNRALDWLRSAVAACLQALGMILDSHSELRLTVRVSGVYLDQFMEG